MNGHVVYGQALFDSGRYDDAEATFSKALGLDPENLIALRHLGDIARLTSRGEEAIQWYSRVLEADPRNDEIQAFISEVNASMAAAAPPERVHEPTPAAAQTAVPVSEATTVEVTPRASAANATPIAPVESVPPPRPSSSLIDIDVDFGAVDAPPTGTATPVAPIESLGDIEFSDMSVGESEPAARAEGPGDDTPMATSDGAAIATGAPPAETAQGGDDLQIDSALSWDMDGNIDLDAEPAAEEGTSAAPPEVFVTETMAELYLQQGFRDEALQVYRQLAEMNPNDESLRDRIRSLESGSRASISFETVPDVEPELASGTDSLIPMPDERAAAPVIEPALEMELPHESEPAAEIDAPAATHEPVAVGDLDFDLDAPAQDTAPAGNADLELDAPAQEPVAASFGDSAATAMPLVAPAGEPHDAPAVALPAPLTARGFFAALAQRKPIRRDRTAPTGASVVADPAMPAPGQSGPLDALFGSAPDPADDAIGQALATAVGIVDSSATIRGRPAKAAASELSLDSVFRSESPARVSGSGTRPSAMLKFDQFFSTEEEASTQTPASDGPAPSPADDAQFQSWLEGLQGKDKA